MKLGKTDVRRCEYCEEPLPPKHTILMPEDSNLEIHLHKGKCSERWALENMIREEAEKGMRKELKLVWDRVCPSCRERLRELI